MKNRKGWRGYALVDPETMYCNDNFFLHKKTAVSVKKKMQDSGWGKLKIIEIDIYPAQRPLGITSHDKGGASISSDGSNKGE